MGNRRLYCSSYHSLAAALALFAVACVLPTNASAQQVRLGGGGGSPVTVEILEDILVTFKPEASSVFANAVGFQLDGVVGTPNTLGFDYSETATPSNILDYRLSASDPLVPVSGAVVNLGNLSQGSDFQVSFDTGFVQFQPGGSFTIKAGSMVWPSPGTDSPWVTTPDTITLTPAMIFAAGEGPQFLANEVTVAAVPEPSTLALAAIAGLGGLAALRRRKRS